MQYSILASNRTGTVRYYPQRWSWSLRNFGRSFGWQFCREFSAFGSTVSFTNLEDAKAYLEHRYEEDRREKQTRYEQRLRWASKRNIPEGSML